MAGSQGRGRNNSLSSAVVNYLKAWLDEHIHHPYPSEAEKAQMVADTGIELKRLNNWVSFTLHWIHIPLLLQSLFREHYHVFSICPTVNCSHMLCSRLVMFTFNTFHTFLHHDDYF
jgi:hypothetical protein